MSGSVTGTGFAYGIGGDAFADQDHNRLFGAVQQLGFTWYRQQISWATHNPAPGQYDWTLLDTMVSNADGFGVQVLVGIKGTPQWAKREGDTNIGPPADNE